MALTDNPKVARKTEDYVFDKPSRKAGDTILCFYGHLVGGWELEAGMNIKRQADGYFVRPETDREQGFIDFLFEALRLTYGTATTAGAASPSHLSAECPTTVDLALSQANSHSNPARR
jgi:hypothetical protein